MTSMKQVSIKARKALNDIIKGNVSRVPILGTNRYVSISALKDYTIERLTDLWLESDMEATETANETMEQYTKSLYRNIKQCVLVVLNSWWKIKLFYKPMVFIWSKIYGYRQEQLTEILAESKKKLTATLGSYWTNTAYLTAMRTDLMKMTKKEAEQYQAELLLVAKQTLSQNTQNMEKQEDFSLAL